MIIIKKDKYYILKYKNRKCYLIPIYYRKGSLKSYNNVSLKIKSKLPLRFPCILTKDNLAPPPCFIPKIPTFVVDPGDISLCLFRNTYIWLRNGSSFWYFPIFMGPRSSAGFRWNGRFWTIFGIDTRQIVSFTCF